MLNCNIEKAASAWVWFTAATLRLYNFKELSGVLHAEFSALFLPNHFLYNHNSFSFS